MRSFGITASVLLVIGAGYVVWNYTGLQEKIKDETLEARARSAIRDLRNTVRRNRDNARDFKIQAEIQRIRIERLTEEYERHADAALTLGRLGRAQERSNPNQQISHNGLTLTIEQAKTRTLEWGRIATSKERQIATCRNIREKFINAVDRLDKTNLALQTRISELDLKLQEMLLMKDQAEAQRTLADIDSALAGGGSGTGEFAVFEELQDQVDEALATLNVLEVDAEAAAAPAAHRGNGGLLRPEDVAIMASYWKE